MGSSCASTGNVPLLKKKRFCGMRQCWCLFCIRTGGTVVREPRESGCLFRCLLTLLPAVLFLERCTVCVCCLPASQPSVLIDFCSLACTGDAMRIKCDKKSSIKLLQNPFVSKVRFGEKSVCFPEACGISSR